MGLCDDNTARNKLLIEIDPIRVLHIDLVTQHHLDSLDILLSTDDQHFIILFQNGRCISDLDLAIYTADARHNKRAIDQTTSFDYGATKQICIGQLDRNLRCVLCLAIAFESLTLLVKFDAEDSAEQSDRHDNTNHTQRISNSITHCDRGVVHARSVGISLLRSTQTGGIGYSTRQYTDHCRDRCARYQVNDICRQYADDHDCRSNTDQAHTSLLKRRKETRSYLHTDRIDKQNQTELLDESDNCRVDLHTETTQCDTDEKDPRDTERDSGNLDFAQRNTDRNSNSERKYRMSNAATKEQRCYPFHKNIILTNLTGCKDRTF